MMSLSRCENQGFNLARVDNNVDTVRFLMKNVVITPPERPRTDARVANRLISGHIGSGGSGGGGPNQNISNPARRGARQTSGAAQRDRVWRENEGNRMREERNRKQAMTHDRNTSWE